MGLLITIEKPITIRNVTSWSYSGFNTFRREIAKMTLQVIAYDTHNLKENSPFYELLNHSDCDGELGIMECEELIGDFAMYDEEAMNVTIEGFYEQYNDLREAILEVIFYDDGRILRFD